MQWCFYLVKLFVEQLATVEIKIFNTHKYKHIYLSVIQINPLRAIFCWGNINIYLHFMSLLHIDLTQLLKFLSQVRPGLIYST